jgi:hypothetical protein
MKERSGSFRFRRIVLWAIVGVAALLFLVSVFTPFLDGKMFGSIGGHGAMIGKVWSFRGSFMLYYWNWILPNGSYGVTRSVSRVEPSFTDYWVLGRLPNGGSYLWGWGLFHWGLFNSGEFALSVTLLVFVGQVITLLSMLSVLLFRRFTPLWLLVAAACNLSTIFTMWVFSLSIVEVYSFQAGFWLAIASDALFFTAFIASLVWNRKEQLSHIFTCGIGS